MAEEEQVGGGDEIVEEDFAVWKKNTPFLYNIVISHALEWPPLTVQWLPSPPPQDSGPFPVHKLVLGTHTSDDFPNFIMIADVHLPKNPASAIELLPEEKIPKVEIAKIHVEGEVNKGRCMIQRPSVVAAKTSCSEVYVFDCDKQTGDGEGGSFDPDLRFRGHDKEGRWN